MCSSVHKLAWDVAQSRRQHRSAEAALQLSKLIETTIYEAENLVHEATQLSPGPGYRPRQRCQHLSQGSDDSCTNWSHDACLCGRFVCFDHFPKCGGSDCRGSAERVPQFTRRDAMLAQQFCDQQRDDSQKMPRLHLHAADAFSADASPEHANEDAERREIRAVDVRQQQRRVALQQLQSHLTCLITISIS